MSEKKQSTGKQETDRPDASMTGTSRPSRPSPPQKLSWKWSVLILVLFLASFVYFVWLMFDLIGTPAARSNVQRVDVGSMKDARKLLSQNPLIDGHNDLPILIRFAYKNHIYDKKFRKEWKDGGLYGQVDLPRMEKGFYSGAFWSAYVSCPEKVDDYSDENYAIPVRETVEQLDLLRRLALEYPKYFTPPSTAEEALSNFKNGTFIAPYIIEGLHQIGNSLAQLRTYHTLGVRYATLTHNCHNRYADAALIQIPNGIVKSKPLHHGVSKEGQRLIREMNRLGMIVDLAHTSDDTMIDVLSGKGSWKGSLAPPIFSHSSARAVCPHPRNVPDHVLKLVKKRNSLVMVNFSPDFISCTAAPDRDDGLPDFDEENATLMQVVKHITHIGELIGYDHVGIGTDFDGIPNTPKGLEDVSRFPRLFATLLQQGVSKEDCAKIAGGNLLRVWGEVDRVAAKMQREGVKPEEDDVSTSSVEGLDIGSGEL